MKTAFPCLQLLPCLLLHAAKCTHLGKHLAHHGSTKISTLHRENLLHESHWKEQDWTLDKQIHLACSMHVSKASLPIPHMQTTLCSECFNAQPGIALSEQLDLLYAFQIANNLFTLFWWQSPYKYHFFLSKIVRMDKNVIPLKSSKCASPPHKPTPGPQRLVLKCNLSCLKWECKVFKSW